MKAIYIPNAFHPVDDLRKLNDELKNTYSVEFETEVNKTFMGSDSFGGTLLIVSEHSRKDKLEELNRISKT